MNAAMITVPLNFEEALEAVGPTGRRSIGNNTRLQLSHQPGKTASVSVILHNTPIVTWHATGAICLDNGGWATRTTAGRMNTFIKPHGLSVCLRGGEMCLRDHATGTLTPFVYGGVEAVPCRPGCGN